MENYTIETEYVWSGARALWVAHLQLAITADEHDCIPQAIQSTTLLIGTELYSNWGRISSDGLCRTRTQEFTSDSLDEIEADVEQAAANIRDTIESIVINNKANEAIASSRGQKRSYSW